MTVDALTVVTVYGAAVTVMFGTVAAVVCLQWQRIGRLCARIREQNEGASHKTVETTEEIEAYRAELQIHADEILRLMVENDQLATQLSDRGRAS